MTNNEDEIKRKLAELETSIKADGDEGAQPRLVENGSEIAPTARLVSEKDKELSMNADITMYGGYALIGVGLLFCFNHIKVGTSLMNILGFGGGGFGFVLLPLMAGLGLLFYDYKNRWGWVLSGGGIALVLFVVLSQLHMYFANISLLGFMLMFLPIIAGLAYVMKGSKLRKQLEEKSG